MPRSQPWTTEKFIERAKLVEKHQGKFDYSKVEYVNSQTKVIIICLVCSTEFEQIPNSHLRGCGCDKCAHDKNHADQTDTKSNMIEKANKVHGVGKFDYTDSNYKRSSSKINIKCITCKKVFSQTPNNHISKGFGCKYCAKNAIPTTAEFIEKAIMVHLDLYDYSPTIYNRSNKNVEIKCKKTEKIFKQLPNNHLRGAGCPCCHPKFSKPSSEYMSYLALENPTIQYGVNEHTIKNSRYKADGYIPKENLVIEFHGCLFHGCPKCYKPDTINPITKLTHRYALDKTREKKAFVKHPDQGYNYREIWGCEWIKAKKCIKLLQKLWKSKHKK